MNTITFITYAVEIYNYEFITQYSESQYITYSKEHLNMVLNTKDGLITQPDAQLSLSILFFPFRDPKPRNVKAFRIFDKLMLSEYIHFTNNTVKRHVIMDTSS